MSRVHVGIISKAPISVRHGIKTPRITESKPPPPPSRFRNSCVPEGKLYPAVPSMEGHLRIDGDSRQRHDARPTHHFVKTDRRTPLRHHNV
ncbi:hypothetical protein SCLCIDRAFT_310824 [Scleroderma citrinum Foug A]|uniref:Uncharacterized protein n=1 Tax=Scleroderma citrinum Foug A TaxID=1036808 RepID=A0A0C3D320_9AGAM|nr:hypothetical protein SCLCIDRAFT_310824 [Scleroderma citrinum Foug A]